MKKLIILSLFNLLIISAVQAEYRVYQYVMKNKLETNDLKEGTLISSTLNPRAFLAYNGGHSLISIDILRTWICPGNTSKQDICPSPYGSIPEVLIK